MIFFPYRCCIVIIIGSARALDFSILKANFLTTHFFTPHFFLLWSIGKQSIEKQLKSKIRRTINCNINTYFSLLDNRLGPNSEDRRHFKFKPTVLQVHQSQLDPYCQRRYLVPNHHCLLLHSKYLVELASFSFQLVDLFLLTWG